MNPETFLFLHDLASGSLPVPYLKLDGIISCIGFRADSHAVWQFHNLARLYLLEIPVIISFINVKGEHGAVFVQNHNHTHIPGFREAVVPHIDGKVHGLRVTPPWSGLALSHNKAHLLVIFLLLVISCRFGDPDVQIFCGGGFVVPAADLNLHRVISLRQICPDHGRQGYAS